MFIASRYLLLSDAIHVVPDTFSVRQQSGSFMGNIMARGAVTSLEEVPVPFVTSSKANAPCNSFYDSTAYADPVSNRGFLRRHHEVRKHLCPRAGESG